MVKKRFCQDLFKENDEETWKSIVQNEGSVQHLEFLSDVDKQVYKTAYEIDQMWVVEHAGDRQPFICQGQSVNLFFPAGSPKSYVNAVHLAAYKQNLKGLYYLRTSSNVHADKVGLKIERDALKDSEECLSCHG